MKYYRFVVGGRGIYEAVEHDCPRDDVRRMNKPDGSWVPKKGPEYPGALSFWTKAGLQKYIESGLAEWHQNAVVGEVRVLVMGQPYEVLYEDLYQIIVDPRYVPSEELEEFRYNDFSI